MLSCAMPAGAAAARAPSPAGATAATSARMAGSGKPRSNTLDTAGRDAAFATTVTMHAPQAAEGRRHNGTPVPDPAALRLPGSSDRPGLAVLRRSRAPQSVSLPPGRSRRGLSRRRVAAGSGSPGVTPQGSPGASEAGAPSQAHAAGRKRCLGPAADPRQ